MTTKTNKHIGNAIKINLLNKSLEASFVSLILKISIGFFMLLIPIYWFFASIAGYIMIFFLTAFFICTCIYIYYRNKKYGKYGFHYKKLNAIKNDLLY